MKRIIARLAIVLGLIAGSVLVIGVTAADAVGPCGSGYSQIDTYNMYKPGTSTVKGHIELYYNGTRNCAIADCYTNCGVAMHRHMYIALSSHSGWDDTDSGTFSYYAGPVYSDPSAGQCIDLNAGFGNDDSVAYRDVRHVHCG